MKFTLNVFLAVVIFCSAALAGDQGAGGSQGCPAEGCPPPPCTENCGFAQQQPDEVNFTADSTDVVIEIIEDFLVFNF